MTSFSPISKNLFFTKNDVSDIRLGDLFVSRNSQDIIQNSFCLVGYPDDEGIKLNGGRTGAALAPEKIREYLYKMTPPQKIEKNNFSDLGDLKVDDDLAKRHEAAKENISNILQKNSKFISLGGGHDYGYPDAAAFVQHYKNLQIR